ncbi:hypothetical protein UFOVP1049_67 [uncultured Caudovirales phage]|uniref:Uncharacterized protein n=1 Tax=uncultured Caudovirales phage TaxID=2100421 RepID=A0A6J5Q967_9CAUD|nr:hypothetical protein UFOVP1049_67 [uncultured Caudovirales phage]
MPLQKLTLKNGVNRENTRYTNEGGWYESDKVRFRQGTPEKIGGWQRISAATFLGVCRSLWNWVTLNSLNLLGVGTNLKFYIENGGAYYDITPIRVTDTLTNPFTTNGTTTVLVTDAANLALNGDYVTFYGGTAVGGQTIVGEYQISVLTGNTYNITISAAATAAVGGGTVYAVYQINTGPSYAAPLSGWGASTWGSGTWGIGASSTDALRIWNQVNWGQNLVYGTRGGPMYYWDATIGIRNSEVALSIATPCVMTTTITLADKTPIALITTGALPTGLLPGVTYYMRYVTATTYNLSLTPTGALIDTSGTQSGAQFISSRGVLLSTLPGSDGSCPLYQNTFTVSDASRFLIAFGVNDYGSSILDPMLIRWSDQESLTTWLPAITNQAGSLRLSHGSKIVTTLQSRQEIVVWTDSALYSLQYLGPPYVWSSQLLADNVSIAGPNAAAMASGITFWMGVDKFYKYDGRVTTLRCDLLRYVYNDINQLQYDQIFASTSEGFNEVWFFYCSETSNTIDRYVLYNYAEDVWAYGTLARTAWLDTGLRNYPIAATYSYNIVNHEYGVDNNETATTQAIEASITSAQFDIGDGHNMAFAWRMLPDLTFSGSTEGTTPTVTMYLQGLNNSGSGITQSGNAGVTHTGPVPAAINVDEFTGQVYIRIRGRQMQMQITSNQVGTQWQLGSPRIDLRPDGRR